MKVYVVTQGYYSDYHICGIYATEEQAKAFCKVAIDKFYQWKAK